MDLSVRCRSHIDQTATVVSSFTDYVQSDDVLLFSITGCLIAIELDSLVDPDENIIFLR
jgi:hypothetical protein